MSNVVSQSGTMPQAREEHTVELTELEVEHLYHYWEFDLETARDAYFGGLLDARGVNGGEYTALVTAFELELLYKHWFEEFASTCRAQDESGRDDIELVRTALWERMEYLKEFLGSERAQEIVDEYSDVPTAGIEQVKQERLTRYADREPQNFYQFDMFANWLGEQGVRPDRDGDIVFCLPTTELMRGSTVRVLIPWDTSRDDVIRGLRKIVAWIEDDVGEAWPPFEFSEQSEPEDRWACQGGLIPFYYSTMSASPDHGDGTH